MPTQERSSRSQSPYRRRDEYHSYRLDRSRSPRTKHRQFNQPGSEISGVLNLPYDVQKNLVMEDLPKDEVKGRWKSFIGKWNRGDLAEGWYDPATYAKAKAAAEDGRHISRASLPREERDSRTQVIPHGFGPRVAEDDENDFGPTLPGLVVSQSSIQLSKSTKAGPSLPGLQDLQVKRELAAEEAEVRRAEATSAFRHERHTERVLQKERLDELVPKAAPGTRERQLEKKREKADSNHAFASAKEQGDVDLRDADVMGDEDSLNELKRKKMESERKKNDREVRREEVLRARRSEREERMEEMKRKEESTMSMLKEIAIARFGGRAI